MVHKGIAKFMGTEVGQTIHKNALRQCRKTQTFVFLVLLGRQYKITVAEIDATSVVGGFPKTSGSAKCTN